MAKKLVKNPVLPNKLKIVEKECLLDFNYLDERQIDIVVGPIENLLSFIINSCKDAITHYRILNCYGTTSLLEIEFFSKTQELNKNYDAEMQKYEKDMLLYNLQEKKRKDFAHSKKLQNLKKKLSDLEKAKKDYEKTKYIYDCLLNEVVNENKT